MLIFDISDTQGVVYSYTVTQFMIFNKVKLILRLNVSI